MAFPRLMIENTENKNNANSNGPIDAVVLWVDGNDPAHKAKRRKYLKDPEPDFMESGILEYRFIETGELKYCIYSIKRFAPWIRTIYLVTDEQVPAWLTERKMKDMNLLVVDHKVLFRDFMDCLPTFNNLSIMSLVWKIPGLAEKHILFNDDTFLIGGTIPEDFFIGRKVVLKGDWKHQSPGIIKIIKKSFRQFIINQDFTPVKYTKDAVHILAARLAGYKRKYFETIHAPLPLLKSIQEDFYNKNPKLLAENVRYRFRNNRQFGPGVLFNHLAFKSGMVVIRASSDAEMIIPKNGGLMDNRQKFDRIVADSRYKFLCFQDMAYLLEQNQSEFKEVSDFLESRIIL